MSDQRTDGASRCRSCKSKRIHTIFSLGQQFVSDFCKSRRASMSGAEVPIVLQRCDDCTLVQAKYEVPQEMLYSRHYWYRSGTTDTMKKQLQYVVDSSVRRVVLNSFDSVLDLGANDGTLLGFYKDAIFGPGYVEDPLDRASKNPPFQTIAVEPASNINVENAHVIYKTFWGDAGTSNRIRESNRLPKIITACGMFYDLPDPNPFIRDVVNCLHPEGIFVAQFMGLKQTVENLDIGNLSHEHLEFYTLRSIRNLFERWGMDIFDIEENSVNGGSYLIFARLQRNHAPIDQGATDRMFSLFRRESEVLSDGWVDRFTADLDKIHERTMEKIYSARLRGQEVAVFGASTKGNVILQWLGLSYRDIEYAIDRSPEKVGKFMAGSGIEIVSEAEGRKRCPHLMLTLPYAFRREFLEREKNEAWRKQGGKFLFPFPKVEVV